MQPYGFARTLTALDQAGLGKRVTQGLIQKATQKIMSDEVDTDHLQAFYEDYWKNKGVPQEIQDKLVNDYDLKECAKCSHPIFDGQTGQSGSEYCSEDCMDDADDRENENLRQCEQCGETYDCEYEGYWVLGEESVCSEDCAWDYLEQSNCYTRFFRANPGYDETLTWSALKAGERPNYDSCREFQDALQDHGVVMHECHECGSHGDGEGGHDIYDIDEGWFCDEECAWKAINDYIESYASGSDTTKIQAYVRDNEQLYDLEGRRDLNQAIDDALDALVEEEE